MTDEEDLILGNIVRAVHILECSPEFASIIPEVRVNIAFSLEGVSKPDEVAAVDGRITKVRGMPKASGYPRFVASDHLARLPIKSSKYTDEYRAGVNFVWNRELSSFLGSYASSRRWRFVGIDRYKEPEEVMKKDMRSMPWKIKELYEAARGLIRSFSTSPRVRGRSPSRFSWEETRCRSPRNPWN